LRRQRESHTRQDQGCAAFWKIALNDCPLFHWIWHFPMDPFAGISSKRIERSRYQRDRGRKG
jgi:hypothetical protein